MSIKAKYRDGEIIETEYKDRRRCVDMLIFINKLNILTDPNDYTIGQKINFPMATGRRVEEQTLIYRG